MCFVLSRSTPPLFVVSAPKTLVSWDKIVYEIDLVWCGVVCCTGMVLGLIWLQWWQFSGVLLGFSRRG